MSDTEVRTTTRMRWMTAVRRQQMVHHLTGTGNMQYMLNMMNWKTEKEQLSVQLLGQIMRGNLSVNLS